MDADTHKILTDIVMDRTSKAKIDLITYLIEGGNVNDMKLIVKERIITTPLNIFHSR